MRILCKNLNNKNLFRNGYFLVFGTKITISPHYVSHVSPSRDVCLSLMAKYLHIHFLDLKLKII